MNTLDILKSMNSKSKRKTAVLSASHEDVKKFNEYLGIHGKVRDIFLSTNSDRQFFTAVPIMNKLVPEEKRQEVFYATKLGRSKVGVPTKLLYLLEESYKVNKTPNRLISNINKNALKPYLNPDMLEEGLRVVDVVGDIVGSTFSTLTSNQKVKRFGNVYEAYIEDIDKVAILPLEIVDSVSREELNNISYDKSKGLVLEGKPLRKIICSSGIVLDDLDLTTYVM